jgi:nickel-dependent lactate racemase
MFVKDFFMVIAFPYKEFGDIHIPDNFLAELFDLPPITSDKVGIDVVCEALAKPIGSARLCDCAKGKKKVLIISDDIHRPTPVREFLPAVLGELFAAGLKHRNIEFLLALGTHRPMTRDEMVVKLGDEIVRKFEVQNHLWDNPELLDFVGNTDSGVPVWVNKKVAQADLVIGLGAIMPIEVCGFTGGGKIIVPGVCGEITNSQMHWTRVDVPHHEIIGKADNLIRACIDQLARKAGLDFIVNVILDANQKIVYAVAGDMIAAHRHGCEIAMKVYGVEFDREYDIVIADGYPFDIEFWKVNKALDTAGIVVKKGGVVIIVSPCYEGFSRTHHEMLKFGYLPTEAVKELVNSGQITHKVVGVHMIQVGTVAVEKARVILVTTGISKQDIEKAGLLTSPTPQDAFEKALGMVGKNPSVAVLKNAARMLPLMNI